MINAQVEKSNNENSLALLRRFNKKIQGAGVAKRVRSIRYKIRNQSKYTKKKRALKVIERKKDLQEQIKLGKVVEKTPRR